MPWGEYAECPNCGKTAYGEDEIEAEFGYRYNHTKPQSWCKECRSMSGMPEDDDSLSVYEAAEIWMSSGMDEDMMYGYTEEELREALQ